MSRSTLRSIFLKEAGRSNEQYNTAGRLADDVIEALTSAVSSPDEFSSKGSKVFLPRYFLTPTKSRIFVTLSTKRRLGSDADAMTQQNPAKPDLFMVTIFLSSLAGSEHSSDVERVAAALKRKLKVDARELRDVLLHEFVHVLDIEAGKIPDTADLDDVASPHEFNAYMHDLRSQIEGKLLDMRIPDRKRMLSSPNRFVEWVLQTLEKRKTFWPALSDKQKRTAIKSIASWLPAVELQLDGVEQDPDLISEIGFYGGYHSMAGGSNQYQSKQLFDEWPPEGYGLNQKPEDDPTLDDNSDSDFYNGRSPDSPDFSPGDPHNKDIGSCEVCGYAQADGVANFDPSKRCPSCGTLTMHTPTTMDKLVKQVPSAWSSPGNIMNAPMGERVIRALVREMISSSQ